MPVFFAFGPYNIFMANSKLFVVKFKIGCDDDYSISKAFAGRLSASQYVESKVKVLLKDEYDPSRGYWEDAWNYRYENAHNGMDYLFEIEEVDVEQSVVLPELPFVENENLTLKAENKELREKLGRIMGMNAAAKCYLVMWDGGWQYDREHVLENMHAARAILECGEEGDRKVEEMFSRWHENRCADCARKT